MVSDVEQQSVWHCSLLCGEARRGRQTGEGRLEIASRSTRRPGGWLQVCFEDKRLSSQREEQKGVLDRRSWLGAGAQVNELKNWRYV